MTTELSSSAQAPAWALPVVLAIAAAMAVAYFPLVADDAYIVARYVLQLYAGVGIVYNAGEYVNALTSPLHFWVMAAMRPLGADFVAVYRFAFGLAAFAVTLALAWRVWGKSLHAAFFLALTVDCPFVVLWMVGGLETPMLLCVCMVFAFLALAPRLEDDPARAAAIVALAAIAVLVRYDASLFVAPLTLHMAWVHRKDLRVCFAVVAGAGALIGWVVFTMLYYGDPLPTSFYVKAGHAPSFAEGWRGLVYLASFGILTWLWVLPVTGRAEPPRADSRNGPRTALWIGIALTLAYAVLASTKHMMYSYRLLVPYLPVLVLLLMSRGSLRFAARAPVVLAALLALQATLAVFVYAYSSNPTLALIAEGKSDAGERFEFSHVGARHTAAFLQAVQTQAATVREHWSGTPLAGSRAPRIVVSTGGLLPFLLPEAYVLEKLVSYRHRCRVDVEPLGDYLQVIYAQDEAATIDAERLRQGRQLIARRTLTADGYRERPLELAVELWYRPSTLPLRLPATIGEACK